jgi:hypothetical protein
MVAIRATSELKAKMMRFAVIRPLYRQVRYRQQDARNFPTGMVSWKYNSALQSQLFFGTNSNSVLGRRAYNMAGRVRDGAGLPWDDDPAS